MSNDLPILPPADVSPQQLYVLIAQLNSKINSQNEEIAELRESVKDLADAWRAASTLVSFVKIIGGFAAAVAAVWAAINIFKAG